MSSPLLLAAPARRLEWLDRLLTSRLFWTFLLVCGLALRCRKYLFAASYWYDESFLVLTVRDRAAGELLGPQPYHLVIPPLFLWLTRGLFLLGGDGELVMRLPAFAADLAGLLLLIPLARKIVRGPHAVWAFAFLVVCRHSLEHACEVRPYTLDLLFAEAVLLLTAVVLDPADSPARRKWASVLLALLAALGPWLSFPSAFMLGGATLALAYQAWRQTGRGGWRLCALVAALLLVSGAAYWWISGRHMFYPGMAEHWGPRGWGGFPAWGSWPGVAKWVLWKPYEIGNYGLLNMGLLLALLGVVGGVALGKRSPGLLILLTAPLVLGVAAGLLGKYPMAHRCTYFLLPSLWLLAALGIGEMVSWGRGHGWELGGLGLLLIAGDFGVRVMHFVRPNPMLDYRGAFRLVQAHRRPRDLLWSQGSVVYQTYYGKQAPVLTELQVPEALAQVGRRRMWAVLGDTRQDLRKSFEASGGHVRERFHVSGLDVLLFEPAGLKTEAGTQRAEGPP